MNNPVFLVDGFTEKLILEKICAGKKINRINCNGNSVSIEALSKRICSLIRLLNNKFFPIIIIVDREEREISCQEMHKLLIQEIRKGGIVDDVRIGICDRMIENWILSDWNNFSENCNYKIDEKPSTFEGLKGKLIIKKFYPSYHETTDAVNLFLKANPRILYSSSNSFRLFVDQLNDVDCFWLRSLF